MGAFCTDMGAFGTGIDAFCTGTFCKDNAFCTVMDVFCTGMEAFCTDMEVFGKGMEGFCTGMDAFCADVDTLDGMGAFCICMGCLECNDGSLTFIPVPPLPAECLLLLLLDGRSAAARAACFFTRSCWFCWGRLITG